MIGEWTDRAADVWSERGAFVLAERVKTSGPGEGEGKMSTRKSQPDPEPRLPVKLEPVSNGEFIPVERPELDALAARARVEIDENARRSGLSRRELIAAGCGAA